jgi:hypothetical protein
VVRKRALSVLVSAGSCPSNHLHQFVKIPFHLDGIPQHLQITLIIIRDLFCISPQSSRQQQMYPAFSCSVSLSLMDAGVARTMRALRLSRRLQATAQGNKKCPLLARSDLCFNPLHGPPSGTRSFES